MGIFEKHGGQTPRLGVDAPRWMPGALAPRWRKRKTALDLEELFGNAVEAANCALEYSATRESPSIPSHWGV
jgi:hypothetical protein